MQDFEFTVEEGRLYLLQTRTGKRTPLAALRIAVDLVDEGLIAPSQALERLATLDLEAIETVHLKGATGQEAIAHGTAASTGIAAGAAVFDPERLAAVKRKAGSVILVRETAETSDIGALAEADALVTAQGARTSHAAVVARQLGKVCVVGCDGLAIEASGRRARFGAQTIEEGDTISVDGTGGAIFRGKVEVVSERPAELLAKVAAWQGKSKPATKKSGGPRRAARAGS
jgi:pyruvate,orthophosphate dikinase